MTIWSALTDAEFQAELHNFEHTAFRLELQRQYAVPAEDRLYAAFLRGEPVDFGSQPAVQEWHRRIAEHVQAGRRIERVRVHDDPPTDYQRFERAADPGNIEAGETIRYLTRQRAREIGLLPAAGDIDWWLQDSSRLIVMRYDPEGRRTGQELITDPTVVIQACKWRDLAVHHSTRTNAGVAA